MEVRPARFTLRNLLVEVTLIALALGLARLAFHRWDDPADPRIIFNVFAGVALFPLCGAIVGGLVGRFAQGVTWGAVAFVVMALISLLFPTVQ